MFPEWVAIQRNPAGHSTSKKWIVISGKLPTALDEVKITKTASTDSVIKTITAKSDKNWDIYYDEDAKYQFRVGYVSSLDNLIAEVTSQISKSGGKNKTHKTTGTKPAEYTKKVSGEFIKNAPIHGVRKINAISPKKPTARKTIKGRDGYSLVERTKKGYCVPETKQTYWKRL